VVRVLCCWGGAGCGGFAYSRAVSGAAIAVTATNPMILKKLTNPITLAIVAVVRYGDRGLQQDRAA